MIASYCDMWLKTSLFDVTFFMACSGNIRIIAEIQGREMNNKYFAWNFGLFMLNRFEAFRKQK